MGLGSKIKKKVKDIVDKVDDKADRVRDKIPGSARSLIEDVKESGVARKARKLAERARESNVGQFVERAGREVLHALDEIHDVTKKGFYKSHYYALGGHRRVEWMARHSELDYFNEAHRSAAIHFNENSKEARRYGSENRDVRNAARLFLGKKLVTAGLTIATAGVAAPALGLGGSVASAAGGLLVAPAAATIDNTAAKHLGPEYAGAGGAVIGVVKGVATGDYVGAVLAGVQGAAGVGVNLKLSHDLKKELKGLEREQSRMIVEGGDGAPGLVEAAPVAAPGGSRAGSEVYRFTESNSAAPIPAASVLAAPLGGAPTSPAAASPAARRAPDNSGAVAAAVAALLLFGFPL